jgi:hypothetical protein
MTAFCLCGHHSDQHDLDGACVVCECMEFNPPELVRPEEE